MHGDSLLMLTTKVVSNKKPPLLSDSESGGSTSHTNTAITAIHEVNLIDFKCKKVIKTTSIAELNNKIQQLLQEEGKKLEEKGLLPKPAPPMFYINYAKKTLTINFYYEK